MDSQQLSIKKQNMDGTALNFDDVAKKAISTLLNRQEIANAMTTKWKSDAESKRKILQEKVRYLFAWVSISIYCFNAMQSFSLVCSNHDTGDTFLI
jgi:hypothetical protein